jgi:hypothetical protein
MIHKAFGHNHHLRHLTVCLGRMGINFRPSNPKEHAPRLILAFTQAFPTLESFHFEFIRSTLPPLGIEVLELLTRCCNLVDLSLARIKFTSTIELIRCLQAWPNLVRLKLCGPLKIRSFYQGLTEGFPHEVVEALIRHKTEGIGLESLSMIKDLLPDLEELHLTMVATSTAGLVANIHPFQHLKELVFSSSFQNFELPDFDPQEAAQYVSSFLAPRRFLRFEEDQSISREFEHAAQGDREASCWLEYDGAHNAFCMRLQSMVTAAANRRSKEKAGLLITGGAGAA